jgi:hypothetical protein
MATNEVKDQIKVFISYSWDDDSHKKWVLEVAQKITERGFYVIFDQFDLFTGKNMTHFMERSVDEADKVIMILTPTYKDKADNRKSGVGYEYSMMTTELYRDQDSGKYLPVIRKGSYDLSAPKFIGTLLSSDMTNDETFTERFEELVMALESRPPVARTTSKVIKTFAPIVNLIDNDVNSKRSQLIHHAHWSIQMDVISMNNESLPGFFKLLIDNKVVDPQERNFLPFIFADNYKKSHIPKITYEMPLQPYMGVSNWAITDSLLIEKGSIKYEFAEYRNDIFLLQLSHPLSSAFYLLMNLKKIHTQLGIAPNIKITTEFKSSNRSLFYSVHSPFDCGTFHFNTFLIPNNSFQMDSTIKNLDSEALYKYFQDIYHQFQSENPNTRFPYLTINRENFDQLTSKYL